jgi:rfaE bifunctional protein kinase chain/domain
MGKEHEFSSDAEQAALEYYGGKLIFGSGETKFSSRDLIKAELMGSESAHITITEKFLAQHKIEVSQLIKRVQLFNRVNVLVLGELIVDEYIYCDPIGMSQEDPTIVVSPISRELFTGGAGIVAAHLSGLGANVTFTTVTGDDEFSESQRTNLEAYGVNCQFISDETRPTILKQRYRTKEKTLLRVNHLASHDISRSIRRGIISRIEQTIKQFDLVVFSDFNYGVLPQPLVDQIVAVAVDRADWA